MKRQTGSGDSRLILPLKGFCMGAADVVPGVSGGTMAFILGIYPRLIDAIKSFDLQFLKQIAAGRWRAAIEHTDMQFLVPLLLGIAAALMFFTRVVPLPSLIISHPELVYGLFTGLIVGSIVMLLRETGIRSGKDVLLMLAGVIGGYFIVTLVPMNTPDDSWFIFVSGAVAICAMILPGISGSFILLILKKYAYVFDAIGHFKLDVIISFGLGAVTGLLLFSRLLSWLLHRAYHGTLLVITGFLIASCWLLWPFQDRAYEVIRGKQRLVSSTPLIPDGIDTTVMASLALMLTGLVMVLVLHYISVNKQSSTTK